MNKTIRGSILAAAVGAAAILSPARATEGAVGRPITGLQAASYSGLIPPTPGWNMQIGYAYYSGDIGGEREIPIGGVSSLGLTGTFDLLTVTGLYIWDTGEGHWNFASMATIPFVYVEADADVRLGPITGTRGDSDSGLFDAFFAPVIASYHIDQLRHVSLSLYIYAPTGDYEVGRLANPSLNNWTFSPTVGYTQLFQKGTLEWSTTSAVDIYTENEATDYQNGAVFRVDSLLVKRFSNGWGIGGVGGWIEQIEDDDSAIADRLDGFKGRSLALGPIATYAKKWDGGQVEFSARWLKEFDVKNRLKGDPFMLSASITF
ncbi:transporter [Lysobacter sp. GCM10012299]|uniref:SphA family protein n=1 Tax=Lysobacter sp. GCM10012299 TaxID=3317333 RepID=UPI00361B02CD